MIKSSFRLLGLIDRTWLYGRSLKCKSHAGAPKAAGAGVQGSQKISVLEVNGVFWPCFDTLAHSFWRSQEVTLFRRHAQLIQGSILDLGCGDGIFGDAAGFSDSAFGIDYDQDSLSVRRQILPTAKSTWGDASSMPFANAAFDIVVSNSVLEHLSNLDATFHEVFRILKPGGKFLFTMTMGEFSNHLLALGGLADKTHLISVFGHLQEPSIAEVHGLLSSAGFQVAELIEYQPLYFSQIYRFLQSPVFQFVERRIPAFLKPHLIKPLSKAVTSSLSKCPSNKGACIWITATKPCS